MNFKTLRQNQFAIRTILILLLSFATIHGASLYVYNTYHRLTRSYLTGPRLARDVHRIIFLSHRLTLPDFRTVIRHLHYTGIHTRIINRSQQAIQNIGRVDLKSIKREILAHPNNFHFEIPLSQSRWLTITTRIQRSLSLKIQFILALMVLVSALTFLIYWLIQRLIAPLSQFTKAVQRYEDDPNAPSIAELGPKPIRNAIRSFNTMQSKLQQFVNDRTQMLAAISHDLRTPLTRLRLRAEDLPDQTQSVKMNRDITEMEQMISSILSFARSDVSDEMVETFDLNALLETLCEDLVDTGYRVTYHPASSRIVLKGRMSGLKRAFNNVIENAVKYGKTADVFLQQKNGKAQIKVNDKGPGIPTAERTKVFLPFYRANAARTPTTSGSGLGLAVTQEIIRLHNGDIQLRNHKDKGLSVIIELPVEH